MINVEIITMKCMAGLRATFAMIYLMIVLFASSWASFAELVLRHSQREHMVPSLLLAFFTLPSSYSVGYLCEAWPEFICIPFVEIACFTLCGMGQAWIFFALPRTFQKTAPLPHRQ